MDVRRVARPLMQALAEHAGVSVNLGVRDRLGMVYLDTYRSASTFAVQLEAGSRIPLAVTSMGRAYLCGLARAGAARAPRAAPPGGGGGLAPAEAGHRPGAARPPAHRALLLARATGARRSTPWPPRWCRTASGELLVFSASGPAFQVGREKLEREIGPRLKNLVDSVRSALAHG